MIDCGGVSHLNLHLADVAGLASRLAPRDPFLVSISISLRGRIWAFTPDWCLHRFGDLNCEVENMQTYFGMSDTKKKSSLQRIIVFSLECGYHFCIRKHSWLRCGSVITTTLSGLPSLLQGRLTGCQNSVNSKLGNSLLFWLPGTSP